MKGHMPETLLSSSCLVIFRAHFGKIWAHSIATYGYGIKCDPPQEFDAKGESTLTTRLHDTLSVP